MLVFFVLQKHKNIEESIETLLQKLRSDEVIRQMNSLLEGFKNTYAKISLKNIKKFVKIPYTPKKQ